MVRIQGLTRSRALALALALALAAVAATIVIAVARRDDSSCGSGADSAAGAVEKLLRAGLAGDEVCAFVPKGSEDDARAEVEKVRTAVGDAGGIDALTITDATSRQMGSEHVVVIRTGSTVLAEWVVADDNGRFLVYPGTPPTIS